MNNHLFLGLVGALALGALSCDDDGTPPPESDAGMVGGGMDAGTTPEVDAGPVTDFPCDYPSAPYGTAEGRKLEPFSLQQCDGTNYDFVNEEFCESSLTVISIAAGWCAPCIQESMQLTEQITERYREDGVRVIQILVQREDFSEPTLSFCNQWVTRFGLTNVELIDPTQITNIYFPDNALPSTIIVDSEGTIRFRENGASDGLITLRARIEQLLEE